MSVALLALIVALVLGSLVGIIRTLPELYRRLCQSLALANAMTAMAAATELVRMSRLRTCASWCCSPSC